MCLEGQGRRGDYGHHGLSAGVLYAGSEAACDGTGVLLRWWCPEACERAMEVFLLWHMSARNGEQIRG